MNQFCQLLAVRYPLIQAPMAGVTCPELAAAVSNAGALGSLGVGAMSAPRAKKEIERTQAQTNAPFNVNVFCHQPQTLDLQQAQAWLSKLSPFFKDLGGAVPDTLTECYKSFMDMPDMLDVFLETKPKMVSFHFGLPSPEAIRALKKEGIVLAATATQLSEAQEIEAAGLDLIIAQGTEAGGHRGIFDSTQEDSALDTQDLTQLLAQHCVRPIVAAGGLMGGQDVARLLAVGASAVQMGSAFLLTPEAATGLAYREFLKTQKDRGTRLTRAFSGRYARGLNMPWLDSISAEDEALIPAYPYTYDANKLLNQLATEQTRYEYGAYWAGVNYAKIQEKPAAELVAQIVQEWQQSA